MLTRRDFLKKSAILAGGVATAIAVPGALMAAVKKEAPVQLASITTGYAYSPESYHDGVWKPVKIRMKSAVNGRQTVSTSVGEVYSDFDKWRKVSDGKEVFNFKKPLHVSGENSIERY